MVISHFSPLISHLYPRLLPNVHGFANTVAIVIDTHQGPVVVPTDRLQMHHAPQYGRLLEMIEPPLAIRRIDQCPLMRTVYMGRALFEHNLTFVGAIDIF